MKSPCSVWRIATDTPDYEAHDLTGEGAKRTGGRWNQKGIPLLYASTSRALACLETVVHVGALPLNRFLVQILIPASSWKTRCIFPRESVVGWDAEPPGRVSLQWGSQWAKSGRTLVAEVPSVLVPEESNLLLNPAHRDMVHVTAVKVRKWLYDARLR